MAEPRSKSGLLEIHVDYVLDRLRESKLAQAYDLLVPARQRRVRTMKEDQQWLQTEARTQL